MASSGYTYKGGYTTYSGLAPRADGWTKASYSSDHACQPVMIDGEGRRKSIISYSTQDGNTECYVTKTEIVEHVPLVIGYKQTGPIRFKVYTDHSDVEDKWNKTSSPEKWRRPTSPISYHGEEKWNRHSSPVYHCRQEPDQLITKVQTEASRPNKFPGYGDHHQSDLSNKEWRRPTSPVSYHGEEKWNRPSSPVYHCRQEADQFITKVQTEASRPNKFPGYGDHHQSDLSNKEWQKASHGAWSTPQGANLSNPTSDISTAMEYLKEARKPTSDMHTIVEKCDMQTADQKCDVPSSRFKTPTFVGNTLPISAAGPKRDGYTKTIDSREAARKYGNMKLAAQPKGTYTATINSREAARKYGGTTV